MALELALLALCTLHRVTSPLTTADVVGDQLTGLSSADMYRRQFVQVLNARVLLTTLEPAPCFILHRLNCERP